MRTLKVMTVIAIAVIGATEAIHACGDKFLVPSRGTRFQRAPEARTPANILLFANPSTPLPATLATAEVDAGLRKVGYRPTAVTTMEALADELKRERWDVILVDAADLDSVGSHVRGTPVLVLPVVHNGSKGEIDRVRRTSSLVVKAPARSQAFVDVIDRALVGQRR